MEQLCTHRRGTAVDLFLSRIPAIQHQTVPFMIDNNLPLRQNSTRISTDEPEDAIETVGVLLNLMADKITTKQKADEKKEPSPSPPNIVPEFPPIHRDKSKQQKKFTKTRKKVSPVRMPPRETKLEEKPLIQVNLKRKKISPIEVRRNKGTMLRQPTEHPVPPERKNFFESKIGKVPIECPWNRFMLLYRNAATNQSNSTLNLVYQPPKKEDPDELCNFCMDSAFDDLPIISELGKINKSEIAPAPSNYISPYKRQRSSNHTKLPGFKVPSNTTRTVHTNLNKKISPPRKPPTASTVSMSGVGDNKKVRPRTALKNNTKTRKGLPEKNSKKLQLVERKMRDQIMHMNRKYEELLEMYKICASPDVRKEVTRELTNLDRELFEKEEKISMIMELYKQVLAVKHQSKKWDRRTFRNKRQTVDELKKLLEQVQKYQDKFSNETEEYLSTKDQN